MKLSISIWSANNIYLIALQLLAVSIIDVYNLPIENITCLSPITNVYLIVLKVPHVRKI